MSKSRRSKCCNENEPDEKYDFHYGVCRRLDFMAKAKKNGC